MFRRLGLGVVICTALAFSVGACGPGGDADGDAGPRPDSSIPDLPDEDGDGIADIHEGRDQEVDTDGDGTPDYLDDDSDGDGIPDYREGGDDLSGTPPVDSDGDTIPDFRDTDSDGNGREDGTDGVDDPDMDGIGNFADLDDDGDGLLDSYEIGPSPQSPLDSDGDGTPDFQDTDSDNDTILDKHELGSDPDMDNLPAYVDTDSDGDCRPDSVEAGDADPATLPVDSDADNRADFLDLDSDNDGLSDQSEDPNCNGVQDPGETSTTDDDSDGDGVSDLIEVGAGTDPNNAADNPQANGDFVFVEPYQAAPSPPEDRLDFSTNFNAVDIYILEDVSGSMAAEINSIRSGLVTMINNITCGPGDDPAVDFCIPDLQSGAGEFARSSGTWSHLRDISANHTATQNALPTTAPGAGEYHLQAMNSSIAGTCASDGTRIGTACFRPNALQVIVLVSDEDFREDPWNGNANKTTLYNTMAGLGTRVLGVTGDHSEVANLRTDLMAMAGGTPSVNLVPPITSTPATPACSALGGSPFHANRAIVSGPDAQAGNALTCALQAITAFLPQDVGPQIVNDPTNVDFEGTPVDAVAAFVDHIEVFQDGSPECSMGNTVIDTNGDTFPDEYVAILPGTPVCWKLFVKQNNTVMGAPNGPQMFMATVNVHGEGGALLDSRDVFFLVPPTIPDVPID